MSYLLNAIYFKGDWTNEFAPEATREEAFNGGDAVPMMYRKFYDDIGYAENDLYQAISLPYGLGAYKMTVFLPREGKSVANVLEAMTDEDWKNFDDNYVVDVKLPRFDTQTDQDLKEIMSSLGMPKAFSENAEFPNVCNVPVYIALMRQVAKIKVNEQGSEAAAVTIIGVEKAVVSPKTAAFHATRPFLYVITEQSTGVVFFIGQYMGRDTKMGPTGIEYNNREAITNNREGNWYSADGVKLQGEPTKKGIYIRNGKKVVK